MNAQKPHDANDQPWLPMPGENQRWYQRFAEYLAMGAGRSVRGVYNRERGNDRSKAVPASWSEATHRFEWQRRAEAYEAWRRLKVFDQGNAKDTERVDKLNRLIDKLFERAMASLDDSDVSVDKIIAQLLAAVDLMAKHTGGYASPGGGKAGKDGSEDGDEETPRMQVFFYLPKIEELPAGIVDGSLEGTALPAPIEHDQGETE